MFNNVSLDYLSNLNDLRKLDLSSTQLVAVRVGSGNLPGLTELNVSSNFLESFETVGNLVGLTVLDLSQNWLSGDIPSGISACPNLRSLFLQGNRLDGGIPNLLNLERLQMLLLAGNYFSGPLPPELGQLASLVRLDLSQNNLTGTVPTLPDLPDLVYLNLDNNSFKGFETDWVVGRNAQSSLFELTISFNQLGGRIPSTIVSLPNLQVLNMSHNGLSGGIPSGFSNLLSHGWTSALDLSSNSLTGGIPADLLTQTGGTGSCVYSLDLSSNLLTGSIPFQAGGEGGSPCFFILDFSENNLTGTVPWSVFGDGDIQVWSLFLQNNQLSGDIFDGLKPLPGWILNLWTRWSTRVVSLQNNLFTGDLSRLVNVSADQLLSLMILDLRNNGLRWTSSDVIPDPIQATLEKLSRDQFFPLREFRVGRNNFAGTSLPTTCFISQSHPPAWPITLDLSDSQLSGMIRRTVFNEACLSTVQFLNLSRNHITGPVPEEIVAMPNLAVLDVSYNRLSGPLPTIPSNSSLLNRSFYVGNGLCNYPLDSCPAKGIQLWVVLITIGGSLTIALMSCLAATWRWKVYRRQHEQDADLIKTLMERDSATLMPLRDLRKATDNFAESAQIGAGGFGTVYKGKLNDGTIVAIKRSKCEGSEKDKQQFFNEVRIFTQVSHRNLVKLLGCCMENKIALLVLEFVSNGTLQEHLEGKKGVIRLTWLQRLRIAVQTADALNYLHSSAAFPIYHRDVKSANILLDDELNAKVADFGISRLAPIRSDSTHVSTAAVQGTIGHIDPEYYTSYQLSDKSDVYSFGVVLLELISAKKVLDFLRGGEIINLVHMASPYIEKGDLEECVDPALLETYTDSDGRGRESIRGLAKLAMACVEMRSKARPSMNEVLQEIQSMLLKFHGSSTGFSSRPAFVAEEEEETGQDHVILLPRLLWGDSASFAVDGDAAQFSRKALGGKSLNRRSPRVLFSPRILEEG